MAARVTFARHHSADLKFSLRALDKSS